MNVPRHPADLLSLVFGLPFAAIGLVLLSGGGSGVSMTWIGPLVAVGLGVLLVMAARSRHRAPDDPPPAG